MDSLSMFQSVLHTTTLILQRLRLPGRFLVGEGVLTKACRKRLKPRQFFLFNDILVYGSVMVGSRRRFNKQRVIYLEEVKMQSLEDDGHYRYSMEYLRKRALYKKTCGSCWAKEARAMQKTHAT